MKVVLSILFTLFISTSVSASVITLTSKDYSTDITQTLSPFNDDELVVANGFADETWFSYFTLTADEDLFVSVQWSLNSFLNVNASTLVFGDQSFTQTDGNFYKVMALEANKEYVVGFKDVEVKSDSNISYDFSARIVPQEVSAPASIFLFAPALLGFIAFRRKAKKL